MSTKKLLLLLLVLIISLIVGFYIHYWLVYSNHIYFRLAFLDENQKVYPINIIAEVKARKIKAPLVEFLGSKSVEYAGYREFFTTLDDSDAEALKSHIDPLYAKKFPQKTKQGVKEFLASWKKRTNSNIDYILPGSKYSYLVNSFDNKGERICVVYRFRTERNNLFYSPVDNHPILYGLVSDWCRAISGGWYGGIAPENKHYNVDSISYLDYWKTLKILNSKISYGSDENYFSLYFDSYRIDNTDINSLGVELTGLYKGFTKALVNKDLEKFSTYVTKDTFERLSIIFEGDYQRNYEDFSQSFDGAKLHSYIDADPLRVVFLNVRKNKYLDPMFVLGVGGESRFSGIGYRARSSDLFRKEEFKHRMMEIE